jgi:hypothetical protein
MIKTVSYSRAGVVRSWLRPLSTCASAPPPARPADPAPSLSLLFLLALADPLSVHLLRSLPEPDCFFASFEGMPSNLLGHVGGLPHSAATPLSPPCLRRQVSDRSVCSASSSASHQVQWPTQLQLCLLFLTPPPPPSPPPPPIPTPPGRPSHSAQVGGLNTYNFLEDVDRFVDQCIPTRKHLFKDSIILVSGLDGVWRAGPGGMAKPVGAGLEDARGRGVCVCVCVVNNIPRHTITARRTRGCVCVGGGATRNRCVGETERRRPSSRRFSSRRPRWVPRCGAPAPRQGGPQVPQRTGAAAGPPSPAETRRRACLTYAALSEVPYRRFNPPTMAPSWTHGV